MVGGELGLFLGEEGRMGAGPGSAIWLVPVFMLPNLAGEYAPPPFSSSIVGWVFGEGLAAVQE